MKVRRKNNRLYDQYKLKVDTFNQCMSSIQTVLTICVAISTGILIALFVELDTLQIIFNPTKCSKTDFYGVIILSGIGFIQSSFCLISIISQIMQCKKLKIEIEKIECKLHIETLFPKGWCKPSLIISVVSSINICFIFFTFSVLALIRLF